MTKLTSVCGCALTITPSGDRPTVALTSGGATVTRGYTDEVLADVEDLASYLRSCVSAVEEDQQYGERHVSLCDRRLHAPVLGLDIEVEDLGRGTMRLRFALVLPDRASLDVCHAAVTLDLSLHQVAEFVAGLVGHLDTRPWWAA